GEVIADLPQNVGQWPEHGNPSVWTVSIDTGAILDRSRGTDNCLYERTTNGDRANRMPFRESPDSGVHLGNPGLRLRSFMRRDMQQIDGVRLQNRPPRRISRVSVRLFCSANRIADRP